MSGRITKTIIDLAGFSFLLDHVRCGFGKVFSGAKLVRWHGRSQEEERSPLDAGWAFAALNALGRAYLLVGKTSSRTTSKQAKCIEDTGRFSGAPSLMMSSSFDKTAGDPRQFTNVALDFVSASLSVTSIGRLATSSESTAQESADSA